MSLNVDDPEQLTCPEHGTASTVRMRVDLRCRQMCTQDQPEHRRIWIVRFRTHARHALARPARWGALRWKTILRVRYGPRHAKLSPSTGKSRRRLRKATRVSASVSKTGWRSNVERPITLSSRWSPSAVRAHPQFTCSAPAPPRTAACSRWRSRLGRRKSSTSSICFSVKGLTTAGPW